MPRFLTIAMCVAWSLVAVAQPSDSFVKMEVSTTTPVAGEPFDIVITIGGTTLTSLTMPEPRGITISAQPYSQRLQGSRRYTQRVSTYQAVAERAGTYTLPPVEAYIDGRAYASDSIVLKVRNAPEPAPRDAASEPTDRRGPRQVSKDEIVFLKVNANKTVAFEGEAILITLELWELDESGIQVQTYRGMPPLEEPVISGFYSQDLPQQPLERKTENGLHYKVQTLKKMIFPTATGDFTIGSWKWTGQASALGRFFSRAETLNPSTEPLHVSVKPLPDRPADFSGAVGSFDMGATLSSNTPTIGEPLEYTITIAGDGNPQTVAAPILGDMSGLHVGDPETSVETDVVDGHIAVTKLFTYQLIPGREGPVEIPPATFVYFDPEQESFVTQRTQRFDLTVEANPEGQHRVVADSGDSGVDVEGEDIRANAILTGPLYPSRTPGAGIGVAAAIPAVAYAGVALWLSRRRRLATDTRYARSHFARSRGRKRLGAVVGAPDPAAELYKALIGFVADKVHVPEEGMTSADVDALLAEKGVEPEVGERIVKTLRACERARYGGTKLSDQELQALLESATLSIDRMETVLQGEGA